MSGVIVWRKVRYGLFIGAVDGVDKYRVLRSRPNYGSPYWRAEYISPSQRCVPGAGLMERRRTQESVYDWCEKDHADSLAAEAVS